MRRLLLIPAFLLLFVSVFSQPAMVKSNPAVACYPQDSLALVAIYNALNGDHWYNKDNWLKDSVYKWHGISINSSGYVLSITLSNNNLSGTLPADIGNFNALQVLNLSQNEITGSIPTGIGNLQYLSHLLLTNNQLENFPDEIYNLTNLQYLELSYNRISAQLNTSIGNLTNLVILKLNHNNFYGAIPPEIKNLSNLTSLDLSYNYFSGNLPAELYDMLALQQLNLSHNHLTGNIDNNIHNLTSLTTLDLSYNKLSGTLPQGLKDLTNLQYLYLQHNYFDEINDDFSNLTNLIRCDISYNKFEFDDLSSANIPVSKLTYLRQAQIPITKTDNGDGTYTLSVSTTTANDACQWYVYDNGTEVAVSGATNPTLQRSSLDEGAYYCVITNTNYPSLSLYSEPAEIGSSGIKNGIVESEYNALLSFYNTLDGTSWQTDSNWNTSLVVGKWYGIYVEGVHVREINLQNNKLVGNLPTSIGDFSKLIYLYLKKNYIKGTLPGELGISSILSADLSYNILSAVDGNITNASNLRTLDLSYNNLSALPNNINSFANIRSLYLKGNKLSDLPDMGISTLSYCSLDYNQLDFGDIENANFPSGTNLAYSYQAEVGKDTNIYVALGENATLSVTVSGTNNQYQWYKGDKAISGATNLSYMITNFAQEDEDAYRCIITNTDYTDLTLYSAIFYVKRGYAVELSVNPTGSGSVSGAGTYPLNKVVSISATPSAGYVFDRWKDNNGNDVSNNATFDLIVTQDTQLIAYFSSTTTLNEDIVSDNIAIYPNPATDVINIRLSPELKNSIIRILDPMGRIYKLKAYENQKGISVDVSSLSPGIYLLQVLDKGVVIDRAKIVVQ